jgi:hypothetical protein
MVRGSMFAAQYSDKDGCRSQSLASIPVFLQVEDEINRASTYIRCLRKHYRGTRALLGLETWRRRSNSRISRMTPTPRPSLASKSGSPVNERNSGLARGRCGSRRPHVIRPWHVLRKPIRATQLIPSMLPVHMWRFLIGGLAAFRLPSCLPRCATDGA